MARKPITQRAKSSPLHVNEALISGAGTAAKGFVNVMNAMGDPTDPPKMTKSENEPGSTTTVEVEKPQVGAYRRACGSLTDGSTQTDPETGKSFVCSTAPAGEEPQETTKTTITTPGSTKTAEMPYYKQKQTDVLTSPDTRKVGRKGNYMNRQSGKLAKQQANLKKRLYNKGGEKLEKLKEKLSKAKDGSRRQENLQKRIKNFESELERNPSYQRLKKKLDATKESAEAFDNFRASQNAATAMGKDFGRRDVGHGAEKMGHQHFSSTKQQDLFNKKPINSNKSVGQGQAADNIRSFSSKYDPNYNLSGYSVFDNNGLGKTITPSNSTKTTIPESFTEFVGKERMKKGGSGINMNSKSAFKMKGYGSKTYKK